MLPIDRHRPNAAVESPQTPSAKSGGPALMDMAPELLHKIFACVPPRDLMALRATDRACKTAVDDSFASRLRNLPIVQRLGALFPRGVDWSPGLRPLALHPRIALDPMVLRSAMERATVRHELREDDLNRIIDALSNDNLRVGEDAVARYVARLSERHPDAADRLWACVRGEWAPDTWPMLEKAGFSRENLEEIKDLYRALQNYNSWGEAQLALADMRCLGRGPLAPRTLPNTPTAWLQSRELGRHEGPISDVTLLPDGRIVTASDDCTARVWREDENGAWSASVLRHEDKVSRALAHFDGSIVTTSRDKTARVWREEKADLWTSNVLEGHTEHITDASVLLDGRIVTASLDGTARVWREEQIGAWRATTLVGHQHFVTCVAGLSDGRIVTKSWDCTTRVWRENKAGVWASISVMRTAVGIEDAITVLPGGRFVTRCGRTAEAWHEDRSGIWMPASLPLDKRACPREATPLLDGRVLFTMADGTSRVLREHENLGWRQIDLGHEASGRSTGVLPDGYIFSASRDRTARIWRVGEWSIEHEALLFVPTQAITDAAVLLDGRVLTLSDDNTAHLWG